MLTFNQDITVDGVPFKKGEQVAAEKIPSGYLQALVWQQKVTTASVQTPLRTAAEPPKVQTKTK